MPELVYSGKTLRPGVDYIWEKEKTYDPATEHYGAPEFIEPGDYKVALFGKGAFSGRLYEAVLSIVKAANTLKVSGKTAAVKYKKLKKKAQTLSVKKVVAFAKKGEGTITYVKASGNKKITINKKTGKVTVKKGLKKGTYKVKVKVTAGGSATHEKATKAVIFKVKIK